MAIPVPRASNTISYTLIFFEYASADMMKAKIIMADWVAMSSLRLFMWSAITPPMRAKNRIGIDAANPTTPSQKAEFVRSSTSHPWATFCIQVPIFERRLPAQNRRKSRCRRAWAMRGSRATAGSAASINAPCARPSATSARGNSISSIPLNPSVMPGFGCVLMLKESQPTVGFEQMPMNSVSFFVSPADLDRRRNSRLKYANTFALLLLFVAASMAQQNSNSNSQVFGLRDFTQQRQWDRKFIAVPDPARAEEHLRILTAEP